MELQKIFERVLYPGLVKEELWGIPKKDKACEQYNFFYRLLFLQELTGVKVLSLAALVGSFLSFLLNVSRFR